LRGEYKEIIVDDQFPCLADSREPAFSRGNGNELWVLILEKAWAKANNSYDNIEAGVTREVLHALTGAPTKYFFNDENPQENWHALLHGTEHNYVMTTGTDDNDPDSLDQVGLIAGHAYSLLAVYEV